MLTCAAALFFAASAASAAASPPTLTEIPFAAGQHGHPYDSVPTSAPVPGAPTIDLNAVGYVEREFQMNGGATAYKKSGFWGSDGRWGVSVAETGIPYASRLLVRYPTNPAKFNGTVVFEWLNDTTGGDQDPLWSQIYQQALRDGYAYVGVTAQAAGLKDLNVWDSDRYQLASRDDFESYDIFTQAAQAIKADSATLLGGLTPKKLIGAGDSQSAFRIDTYVNAIQPVTHAFNGFLGIGRAAVAAPIGNGLIPANGPLPAFVRTDNTAPFIQVNTEGDIIELGAGLIRQSDSNTLRTWEVPGAAHIDGHEAAYELATISRDQPDIPVPECQFGTPITGTGTALDGINQVNNMPLWEVEDAALVALHKWLTQGVQPAHSPKISTTRWFFAFDVVSHDRYGNALGGIRLPDIQVPIESYSALNFSKLDPNSLNINPATLLSLVQQTLDTLFVTGEITDVNLRSAGLCMLSGFFLPLSKSTLTQLYPTHSSYVSKFTTAANAAVTAGFLTPPDRDAAVAAAQAAAIP